MDAEDKSIARVLNEHVRKGRMKREGRGEDALYSLTALGIGSVAAITLRAAAEAADGGKFKEARALVSDALKELASAIQARLEERGVKP